MALPTDVNSWVVVNFFSRKPIKRKLLHANWGQEYRKKIHKQYKSNSYVYVQCTVCVESWLCYTVIPPILSSCSLDLWLMCECQDPFLVIIMLLFFICSAVSASSSSVSNASSTNSSASSSIKVQRCAKIPNTELACMSVPNFELNKICTKFVTWRPKYKT